MLGKSTNRFTVLQRHSESLQNVLLDIGPSVFERKCKLQKSKSILDRLIMLTDDATAHIRALDYLPGVMNLKYLRLCLPDAHHDKGGFRITQSFEEVYFIVSKCRNLEHLHLQRFRGNTTTEYDELPSFNLFGAKLPPRLTALTLEHCNGIGQFVKEIIAQSEDMKFEKMKLWITHMMDLESTYKLLTAISGLRELYLLTNTEMSYLDDVEVDGLDDLVPDPTWKWTHITENHRGTLERLSLASLDEEFTRDENQFPNPEGAKNTMILGEDEFPRMKELFVEAWIIWVRSP